MSSKSKTENGFAQLYQNHAANVLGLLVRLCNGDRAEAEDLTQETFVAAYQGHDGFQQRGNVRAWLLGIAFRRWRDRSRRRTVPTTLPPEEEDLADPNTSHLEHRSVTRITLDGALLRLELPYREALLLVVSQGLTYREAAEITGEPVGTVKWRVHQATRQMRVYLNEVEEEANGTTLENVEDPSVCAQSQI